MLTQNFVKVAALVAFLCFGSGIVFAQDKTAKEEKVEKKAETKQEDKSEEKSKDESEEEEEVTVASLKAKYNKAYAAFLKAYREETDRKEKSRIVREMLPRMTKFVKPVMKIVDEDPTSDDAFEGLTWIASSVRNPKQRENIVNLLLKHHVDKEEMGQFALGLIRDQPSKKTEDRILKIFANNQHDEAKGKAAYAYISYLSGLKKNMANEDFLKFMEKRGGEEFTEYIESINEKELDAKVNKYIKIVQKDYSDVILRGELTLGKKLEGLIFERDRLQIGMEVPDIVGEDIDGTEFKLSDYRGKVVMIDFWGDW